MGDFRCLCRCNDDFRCPYRIIYDFRGPCRFMLDLKTQNNQHVLMLSVLRCVLRQYVCGCVWAGYIIALKSFQWKMILLFSLRLVRSVYALSLTCSSLLFFYSDYLSTEEGHAFIISVRTRYWEEKPAPFGVIHCKIDTFLL